MVGIYSRFSKPSKEVLSSVHILIKSELIRSFQKGEEKCLLKQSIIILQISILWSAELICKILWSDNILFNVLWSASSKSLGNTAIERLIATRLQ